MNSLDQWHNAVLLLSITMVILSLTFAEVTKDAKISNRKEYILLDQDYYLNLKQNTSGIILKVSGAQFHHDTEKYLVAKLKHLLLYGMKKMAVNANYSADSLDKFFLAHRRQVKEKMCDVFEKLYSDFLFRGMLETKKFIRAQTFRGLDYNAMKKRVEVHNYWKLNADFNEKTEKIRQELRKVLTNTLVYFERCFYYHYYRKKALMIRAYQWDRNLPEPDYMNYFIFVTPDHGE